MKLKIMRAYGNSLKQKYPELFKKFNTKEEENFEGDYYCVVELQSLEDLLDVLRSTNNNSISIEEDVDENGATYLWGVIDDSHGW